MKALFTSSSVSSDGQLNSTSITPTSKLVKKISFLLVSFSLLFLFKHLIVYPVTAPNEKGHLSFFNPNTTAASSFVQRAPMGPKLVVERTGIIDEMGFMTDDFIVGEFDEGLIQSVVDDRNVSAENDKREGNVTKIVRNEKLGVWDESMSDYIPCFDNVESVSGFILVKRGGKNERHCPEIGRRLNCLVPRPKHYKIRIPWPKRRDEVWFDNVPHTRLVEEHTCIVEERVGQNRISKKMKSLYFPGWEVKLST